MAVRSGSVLVAPQQEQGLPRCGARDGGVATGRRGRIRALIPRHRPTGGRCRAAELGSAGVQGSESVVEVEVGAQYGCRATAVKDLSQDILENLDPKL
jgi:hypothetical protein